MAIIVVKKDIRTAEIREEDLANWEAKGYTKLGNRDVVVKSGYAAVKPVIPADSNPKKPEVKPADISEILTAAEIKDDIINVLKDNELDTLEKLSALTEEELIDLPLIGKATAKKILAAIA